MEVPKDTGKQEKRRMAIRGTGNGVGGIVVWGGVAVIAASVVVASVSAFKSWKTNRENTRAADEFDKGNEQTDTPSMENDAQALEIIGKMREDKVEHESKVPNDENKDVEEAASCLTLNDSLVKGQVNGEKIESQEEMIVAVPKPAYVESDSEQGREFGDKIMKKDEELAEEIEVDTPILKTKYDDYDREQGHELGEKVVKKDEELAEEIEVDSPMSHENEEESDENSIDENGGEIAEEVTDLQQMEKQQEHVGYEIVEREVETAPLLNRFPNEGKFEVIKKESVQKEEKQEYEGKFKVEKEEESSETNEEDEEEESEENSEGTGDSSMESIVDAIWPAEAMEDVSMEIKHQKIDNQVTEKKIDDCIQVETDHKSLKKDNSYTTNHYQVEDSGQPVFNSRKRHMKELLFNLSNTRTLVWAILVLVLALAAPLVLSPKGILKLSLVTFFVISVSRVLKTII